MELKRTQIRLGGISRLPSERMTADGECWESVNLVADNGETVASRFPAVVEDDGLPPAWETDARLVFVHTTSDYTHYIMYRESGRELGVWNDDGGAWFMSLGGDEELRDIASIGNTLVVATSEATHYVLWKDGSYRDLGTELPKPAVQFVGGERERRGVFVSGTETKNNITEPQEVYDAIENEVWLALPSITASEQDTDFSVAEVADHGFFFCGRKSYKEDSDNDEDESDIKEARTRAIWDAYADAVAYAAKYNKLDYVNGRAFYQPYLFRYALRLYDGTYAMQSVPILVGGGVTWPQFLGDVYIGSGHHTNNVRYGFAMIPMFSVRAVMEEAVSEDWSDIVTSVDIFCSSPINPYDPETATISQQGDAVYVTDLADGLDNDIKEGMDWIHPQRRSSDPRYITVSRFWLNESQIEAKLLNSSVFYRIGSFLIDNSGFSLDDDYDPAQELTANQEDLVKGIQLKKPDADALVTHANTSEDNWDDYECDHTFHSDALKVMNQRLAIWDIDKTLGRGLPVLNGQATDTATMIDGYSIWRPDNDTYMYRFCYVVDDNGEERFVWGNTSYSSTYMEHRELRFAPFRDAATRGDSGYTLGFLHNYPVICAPFAWLAYPDAKCERVLFQRGKITGFTATGSYFFEDWEDEVWSVPMKEHPFLNCAYAWLGFAQVLEGAEAADEDKEKFNALYEDRLVRDANTIMLSGVANPFTFPTAGRYTFDYAVVSCAAANMPLSTGQFGDFQLYVFTEGGIYAMQMSSDGTFVSSAPYSRDVALSRKTVSEVDRGVIFATVKGVRAIEGGQMSDLSALMLGEPLPFPDDVADILADCGFGNGVAEAGAMSAAYLDGTPFLSFLEGAECLYDYTGQRLVFVSPDFLFQYVYRMGTGTWHKTCLYNVYGAEDTDCISVQYGVNSYPKCYVTASSGTGYAVLDLCTALEPARRDDCNDGRTLGVLLTRTMDLGSPDVFKSIRDLRVRGDFPKGDVQYVLLASNNNRDWVVRSSLRGPSFRFYRLLLVTRLSEFGRIAYVEMDYEERFSNRLR